MGVFSSLLPGFLPAPPHGEGGAGAADVEELVRLGRTMRRIRAALDDGSPPRASAAARLRLRELRALAYDAEDVVGECQYEAALEPTALAVRLKRVRREVNDDYLGDADMVPAVHGLAARAKEIRARLNEIVKEYEDLCMTDNDGDQQVDLATQRLQRYTSSIVHEPSIHGRDVDKNNVIKMLLSEVRPMSVLAIVDMGGLGKTTLAQLKQKREVLELNDVQEDLIEQIEGKKLLLVLDDVWNEHRAPWDSLCSPLMATKLCKIIVTTRSKTVARLVQTMPFYSLNCLSSAASWSLFEQITFEGQDPAAYASFIQIGEGIVERCKGLPLAIKTLGGMLRYESNEERWKDVLESDLWDLDPQQNDIFSALELSYSQMPVHLKRCFMAISLFPKDYHFQQDKLICLWKSLDLLHTDNVWDKDRTGRLYLSDLLKRSLIQCNDHAYSMHDLTHDLACCVADEEFLRFENGTPVQISNDVRNISIFLPWTALRAVIISSMEGVGGPIEISEGLFLNSKQLRTIVLDGVSLSIPSLPDSVGNLKHLRHLVLRNIGGLVLPVSICRLFNLQTLDVTTSGNLKPACIPNGIRRLTNLHKLPVITVKRGDWHCNLRDLKDLQNLSGKLCLKGLDNVTSADEAEEANLCSKQHLQALNLAFPDGDWQYCEHGQEPVPNTASHQEILESLRPNSGLIELSIEVCRTCRYPSWLGDTSFSKITMIKLEYCEFECMPPLGQLSSLKYLMIAEMSRIGRIGPEFCSLNPRTRGFKSLVTLEFDWMPRWLQWSGVGDGAFTCLHTLSIQHASELRSLPCELSSSLAQLKLRYCKGLVRIPYLPSLIKLDLRQCNCLTEFPAFPMLERLDIGQCTSLVRLPDLPLLKVLILRDCPNLTTAVHFPSLCIIHVKGAFRDELLYHLMNCNPSLENILIVSESIVRLSVEPQNLPSLLTLRLSCPNLQCFDGLDGLTYLTELKIYGCPKFSVPNLLPGQM
ncbi:hypothetical protein BS78_06G067600 [Paspalum vaginatum]|nr:hypothetical protein BS78_06G067600 [Paspalum vaginatum]